METTASNQYYSLEEVIKLLDKSRSTVIRETNAGKIPSEGEKRNRRYPKEAIDAIVEIKEHKEKKNKQPLLVFSPSSPNDLWQEVNIGRELYGDDDIVPYKQLLEWLDINDEIFMSLKYNNKVVGYSSLMPIDEDVMIALVKDQIRETDIPNDAIKQWSDPNTTVYVSSVTIKPTGNHVLDEARESTLIKNTVKWALSLDRQFNIKNWYSIGATKDGQRLLENLGFSEIVSLYDGERKGYLLQDIKKPTSLINKFISRQKKERDTKS